MSTERTETLKEKQQAEEKLRDKNESSGKLSQAPMKERVQKALEKFADVSHTENW